MNRISAYTIFVLETAKTFFWSLGMIFFDMKFHTATAFFAIGDYWLTKYTMLAVALLSLANLYYNRFPIYVWTAFFYMFLTVYVAFGFGFSSDFNSSSFVRNGIEALFVIFMFIKIQVSHKT